MTVMRNREEWGTFSQEAQGWPLKSAHSAETSLVKARRKASRLLTIRSTDWSVLAKVWKEPIPPSFW